MAVGLAAFQTVLDDGNVYDWFGSPFIVKLSLVAAAAIGAFVALVRPQGCFGNRLSVVVVVLLPLHKRLHIDCWNDPRLVA